MYHMWAESLVGVVSNDLQRHALILASEPAWPPGALNRRKYVVYNTREGMTRPGQWYLDRAAGRLVYWPRADEDMAKVKIVAPTAERVVRIAGTRQKPVEKITLRGLTLQATTAPLKPAGEAFQPAARSALNSAATWRSSRVSNRTGAPVLGV